MSRPKGSRRRARLGLRARSSLAFALMALVLSAVLVGLTYELSRRYLLDQRESLAVRQAVVNARVVGSALVREGVDWPGLLATLPSSGGSSAVLERSGEWFAASLSVGQDDLPASLLERVAAGDVAVQRTRVGGQPAVVVGVPVPAAQARYFEVFPLSELQRTLRTLAAVLGVAAAVTTAAGALLGRLASRQVLRPLGGVAATATDIADGRLDARLAGGDDPDLAPLTGAFNDMVDSLRARIENEARFASNVSHELRTPLTALRASVEVLERRLDGAALPALEVLQTQVTRFERLLLDLLDISRFDAGTEQLALEDTEPARLVAAAVERLGYGDVPVVVDPSTPRTFRLDRRRLERILGNLLENAQQHAGGAVRVAVRGTGDGLQLAVDDAGPGVPAQERTRVFDRFHRLDGRGAPAGTGLGLAIVAEHCELHGGTVRVEDADAGGARFVVEIPAVPR
jgi:two-component system sensor histidine kinase MtrB